MVEMMQMTDGVSNALAVKPRRPRWPWIVVGLLGAHVSLMAVCVTVAVTNHAASGVIPDYYQQAVAWDEHRAEREASEALGWSSAVVPSAVMQADGRRVAVEVTDAEGQPLTDALVTLTCFAERRSLDVLSVSMQAQGGGVYAGVLPIHEPGLWVFRVRAERGGDVFLDEQHRVISALGQPGDRS